ncbi:translation initiation factor IF-2 N-terminal domain-containing protein, partial [Candidatus Desantisbacteria bacterium]|nr:translation initiation factor IF-2 N-terminal domain-containing protein [Candidatus Desantisbacteria bacterium]
MSRVYEVAKELGTDSKTILSQLKDMGIQVKNHMSSIDDVTLKKLKEGFPQPDNKIKETALPKPVKKAKTVKEEKISSEVKEAISDKTVSVKDETIKIIPEVKEKKEKA